MSVKNNISIFYTLCGKGKNMKAIDKIALILVLIFRYDYSFNLAYIF